MSINPFENYPLSWRPDKRKLKRPLYLSLVEQMRDDIKNGRLLPGTKLPPQRELADYLDVGFSTITRAYNLSQKEGITYGRVGQGTFVSGNVNSPLIITRDRQKSTIKDLGFVASFESTNRLAASTIQSITSSSHVVDLLNYDSPTGMPEHKITATAYLNRIGMTANAQNTVITSGGENALVIAIFGLFHPGDRLAVDEFTYANLIEIARLHELTLVPVKGDSEGMKAESLRKICENQTIKGIYLMPDCNNPTTVTVSAKRRKRLADVIKQFKLILIEDDYLNFFNLFRKVSLPKMSQLVPEHSIYIASMSKTLISGLRVAFMRFSDCFQHKIESVMFVLNVKTSSVDAAIVAKLLENGQGEKIMSEKISKMTKNNQVFDSVFPEAKPGNGFFRQLTIDSSLPGQQVEKALLKNGLRVFHSDRFTVGHDPHQPFLRVSLSAIDDPMKLKVALQALKTRLIKFNF